MAVANAGCVLQNHNRQLLDGHLTTTLPWHTAVSLTCIINMNPLMCGSVDLVYNR